MEFKPDYCTEIPASYSGTCTAMCRLGEGSTGVSSCGMERKLGNHHVMVRKLYMFEILEIYIYHIRKFLLSNAYSINMLASSLSLGESYS